MAAYLLCSLALEFVWNGGVMGHTMTIKEVILVHKEIHFRGRENVNMCRRMINILIKHYNFLEYFFSVISLLRDLFCKYNNIVKEKYIKISLF